MWPIVGCVWCGNAAYSFARALADGKVDLDTYRKPAISDPCIVAMTRVTRVVSHTIASLENAQDSGRAIVEAFPA